MEATIGTVQIELSPVLTDMDTYQAANVARFYFFHGKDSSHSQKPPTVAEETKGKGYGTRRKEHNSLKPAVLNVGGALPALRTAGLSVCKMENFPFT